MPTNFHIPGQPETPVVSKVEPREADIPWYVPGLPRRPKAHQPEVMALSYAGVDLTYLGLKLTYSKIL